VEADRTAEVNTAGDSSALLAITEGDENGEYLKSPSGDEVVFDITEGAQGSEQINLNATTHINESINVTNNGANSVALSVSLSGDNSGLVSITESGTSNDLTDTSVSLGTGSTVELNVTINTRADTSLSDGDEIIDTITFEANDNS
jgi:hypothetical protein